MPYQYVRKPLTTDDAPEPLGPVQLWRLMARKVELEGAWIVKNREFIRLGETADRLD